MNQANLMLVIAVIVVGAAWISFAEHPTARNLRRAVIDTLEFLD
jgi:hypothetical protein